MHIRGGDAPRITESFLVAILTMLATRPISHKAVKVQKVLSAYARKSTLKGGFLFLLNAVLYGAAMGTVIFAEAFWLKMVCGLVMGVLTALLFVVGHDACHNSLTPYRKLNKIIGRMAFLPSFHAFSLWDLGHNRTHHVFTNLKGYDYVFAPLSKTEYDNLRPSRRMQYRLYRSLWGHWLYYLIEIWWKKMYFPAEAEIDRSRFVYKVDCFLVSLWALALFATGITLLGSLWQTIVFLFILPQFVWNWLMSFAIYQHHTHPNIKWFSTHDEWSSNRRGLQNSAHIVFPKWFGLILHNIMEHTAHHAYMQIPLYELIGAQGKLENNFPEEIVVEEWSLNNYLRKVNACKLYDFSKHQWLDFAGRPTSKARAFP